MKNYVRPEAKFMRMELFETIADTCWGYHNKKVTLRVTRISTGESIAINFGSYSSCTSAGYAIMQSFSTPLEPEEIAALTGSAAQPTKSAFYVPKKGS